MRTGSSSRPPQRTLVCNRTGAALGRSAKLDGAYWRRHARQPVEFAKSVRTLADLGCAVLLEVGPQPVLTAAALRAWPDPATAPRAIASLRRNGADQRQITEAFANAYVAGHLPDFAAFRQAARAQARPAHLPVPAPPVLVHATSRCSRNQHQHVGGRAPRPSGFSRTAGSRNSRRCSTVRATTDHRRCAEQACRPTQPAAHTQSIADARYEIRWEKSAAPISGAEPARGSTWLLIGDDAEAVQPLVDALTARGHRHRILGLPASDADEEQLAAALRAAAADEPTLRILHLAALDAGRTRRRRGRCCGCSTESWAGHSGSSVPRSPPNCAGPIWLVTRGAQRVTDADTVSPEQTCLWGFGRAASLEHPQLWGGLAECRGGADEWSRLIGQIVAAPAAGKTRSRCAITRSTFPG